MEGSSPFLLASWRKSGIPVGNREDGSALIWQCRYWEHTTHNADDLNRHIDYSHFNPVKHGLVERVIDWLYSSFHRYVGQGLLPPNWACESFGRYEILGT